MRAINPSVYAALQQNRLVARDFLWIEGRRRDNPAVKVGQGFWSDVMTITAEVREPINNSVVTRTFVGSGGMIGISAIAAVSNITVQTATVTMSHIDPAVKNAVMVYDLKQATVEIYRGLFDPDSGALVNAAVCRFFGFVDGAPVTRGPENSEGHIELTCVSHTQELTRSNPDTRSDESQKKRLATDNFYQDTATVGERRIFWGRVDEKAGGNGFVMRLAKATGVAS